MDTCVFCKIVQKEAPVSPIFEDNRVLAFLDIMPVTEGHTLLIPKVHAPNISDLDSSTIPSLFGVAQEITGVLYKAIECDGVNWFLADGEDAGQEVFHFHLHLIPRYKDDGFGLRFPAGYEDLPPRSELDNTASKLRTGLKEN